MVATNTPFNGNSTKRYKRVYKKVNAMNKSDLEPQIKRAEAEGWTRGKTHTNIDAIYPYEHHLYRDLDRWPDANPKRYPQYYF